MALPNHRTFLVLPAKCILPNQQIAKPSSLYKPIFFLSNYIPRWFKMKSPAIVLKFLPRHSYPSNKLLLFVFDLRFSAIERKRFSVVCFITEMSSSKISAKLEAQGNAWFSNFLEIDGKMVELSVCT